MKMHSLEIEQDTINQAVNEQVRGVTVKIMMSPFDVPQSVDTGIDEDTGTLFIVFHYLGGDEQTLQQFDEQGVTLSVGRNSQRLYKISLKLSDFLHEKDEKVDLKFVFQSAEKSIEAFKEDNPRVKSRSFEAVHKVLQRYSDELGQPLEQQAS